MTEDCRNSYSDDYVALGALAVQGLHAQAKPPLYSVAEFT
jgi:hypothetical protein